MEGSYLNQEVEVNNFTCIDPVTNLVELIENENETVKYMAQQSENYWLARHLWP